jgi:predicted permease
MRQRVGDDLLRCHDTVMAQASGRLGRLRVWGSELWALLRAGVTSRRWSGPPSPRDAGARRVDRPGYSALADDLVHASRSLARSPASTAFVVLMLGGGLGAAITVYSAVRHTLLHPLPYDGADRLVRLWRTAGGGSLIPATAEQVEQWGGQRDLVERTLRMAGTTKTLTGRGEPEAIYAIHIPGDYFRTLGVEPTLGRSFAADEVGDDASRSLLLGYGVWQRSFGADAAVLGTTVTLDGEPWIVVGVGPRDAPPPTGFPEDAGFWLPLTPSIEASSAIAILRPGVPIEALRARIDTLVARAAASAAPSPFGGTATSATRMAGMRLRSALTTLSAAVGLLLLITCLNVSILLVNRADRRRHETAVRMALGVGRVRLIRQLLIESLLLAGGAGVVGVTLAGAGLRAIRLLKPVDLVVLERVALDGPVLAFGLALTAATGLAFGLLPALQAGSHRALDAVGRGQRTGRGDGGSRNARWGLVVAEVALSFVLLVGSALLVRTMLSLQRVDPGFEPEAVLVAHVSLPTWSFPDSADRGAAWDRIAGSASALGVVESLTLASGIPPASGVYFGTLEVEGREVSAEESQQPFFGNAVGPEYFAVLGQRIVAGRGFTPEETRDGTPAYVLSESTARALWPDDVAGAAVGRRMRLGDGEWQTVVGVVADVVATGLTADRSRRQLYAPLRRDVEAAHVVLRVAGDPRAVIPALVERLRAVAPDAPLELTDAKSMLGQSVSVQRFTSRLLALLAVLAAVLACAGLYGVVAHVVGRRTREVGIRMSLGARAGSIVWMMLSHGGIAVAVGVALGVLVSSASARIIESLLFEVDARDPISYLAAALVLGAAALLATWLPARRAARIDPVRAISRD